MRQICPGEPLRSTIKTKALPPHAPGRKMTKKQTFYRIHPLRTAEIKKHRQMRPQTAAPTKKFPALRSHPKKFGTRNEKAIPARGL